MVFDGENEKLYVQGYERERAPSEGTFYVALVSVWMLRHNDNNNVIRKESTDNL